MRISEVEFVGFKSFVDKTRVKFTDSITGVVGPNGCGKSNIVDAIKWVMGELSAKSLRGDSMEDVIFNGTETRKPLSMAQVSLVFSTEDGVAPAGYELYQAIEITRRLYRSGESEYLINKQPARLKDIQELLMDTGLGAKAYSIVEQGQISKVISARPEERRLLIEEAAGITKFRVRKEEALRKVERTLSDLDRVQDIVAEIKRQMTSLARQAGKARKYKEVKGELREVDLELAARRYKKLSRSQDRLGQDLQKLQETKDRMETTIEAGEAELSASRLTLAEMQAEVERARKELAAVNDTIRGAENDRNILARDIENETNKARTFEEEIVRANERIAMLEASVDEGQREAENLVSQIEGKQSILDEQRNKLGEQRELLKIKSEDTDQVRTRQMELVGTVAKLQSAVDGWAERKADLENRSEDLKGKKARNAERLVGLRDRAEALRARHAELYKTKKDVVEKLAEKTDRLASLKELIARQREQYEQARDKFQQVSVRLASLSEMKKNMEGYREGVRSILMAAARENEQGGTIQGVVGVVADLVKVPEKYEAAFEAVLGERLQSVVVDDVKAGVQAAGFLKHENSGRGSFVPKTPRRYEYTEYPDKTALNSEGPLLNMLSFDPEVGPVVKHLLDGVLVVNDLPKAVDLHKANGYKGAFVTLDGEILDPHGTITGGSREALTSGILQMKREIETLTENAAQFEAEYEKSRDAYHQSLGLIDTQERAVQDLTKRQGDLGLELREVEAEVQRTVNEIEALEETQDEIDGQIAGLFENLSRGDAEIETKDKALREQRGELELVRRALGDSESGAREISERIESLNAEVSTLAAEISGNREKAAAAQQRTASALQSIDEARERIDRLRAQIDQSKVCVKGCKDKITQTVKNIEVLVCEAEEKAADEATAKEKLDAFVQSVRDKDDAIKMMRKDMEGVSGEISQLNMSAVELKLTRENLSAQIEEKYNEKLEDLLGDYGDSEIDVGSLDARQKELNRQLRGLGEVNLTAIEEYDEAKKRYDFYMEQQQDLLDAIDNLKQAISKINKESRERFAKTFQAVAAKFAEVIPMLFGGGTAQLTLTESNDVLDAGVEVLIRPPGKKLQNMNLMSGGEKALAAIGLIFSIFLIKPSPFCLLDEVDAPLDDANIHRFNDLLDEIANLSQVILITHNKRTMEKAATLYGITMQEKGVSKLVSVKFDDIKQEELDQN